MSEITDLLHKVYGKKIREEATPDMKLPPGPPPKPIPANKPKSVGDVSIALEAQRIYSPEAPPAPPSAPKAEAGQGTVGAMDLDNSFLGNK